MRVFGGDASLLELAQRHGTTRLLSLPLDPAISAAADAGVPIGKLFPSSRAAQQMVQLAEVLLGKLQQQEEERVDVQLLDARELLLLWADGRVSRYHLRDLQERCPCIVCQENRQHGRLAASTDVAASSWRAMGRYGIQLEFLSGCSQGIYSYLFLRQLAFSSSAC